MKCICFSSVYFSPKPNVCYAEYEQPPTTQIKIKTRTKIKQRAEDLPGSPPAAQPLTWRPQPAQHGPGHRRSPPCRLPSSPEGQRRVARVRARPWPPPASSPSPLATPRRHLVVPRSSPSLSTPFLALYSFPERDRMPSSPPSTATTATGPPSPCRCIQKNRRPILNRIHQPVRPREPCSVVLKLIFNLRPLATSSSIRRRPCFPELADLPCVIPVSP